MNLRYRGIIGPCTCKFGSCRKYNSRCKRCGCACDGVPPTLDLSRHRGAQQKRLKSMKVISVWNKKNQYNLRKKQPIVYSDSTKLLDKAIAASCVDDEHSEDTATFNYDTVDEEFTIEQQSNSTYSNRLNEKSIHHLRLKQSLETTINDKNKRNKQSKKNKDT